MLVLFPPELQERNKPTETCAASGSIPFWGTEYHTPQCFPLRVLTVQKDPRYFNPAPFSTATQPLPCGLRPDNYPLPFACRTVWCAVIRYHPKTAAASVAHDTCCPTRTSRLAPERVRSLRHSGEGEACLDDPPKRAEACRLPPPLRLSPVAI